MTDFVVHGVPGSPYVRAALLGLEEKGARWRLKVLDMGDAKGPAHLEHQPFGRIPAIEHGDFRLYEVQAILRYLDRVYPTPSWTPSDHRAEARMNQICGITDWYVMPDISSAIAFQRAVAPRFGIPVDEARIAAALPRAKVCMVELSRLLGDKPFMAGDTVTIADLMLAPQLDFFTQVDEGAPMFAALPNLKAWVDRMNARPSMQRTTWARLTADAEAA
jgi:glutathione S-transferase